MKITFAVITMNEERNLRRCLASCREVADEFVVVDSGSADGTQVVAREFGAHVVVMERGRHVDWKNRARQEASYDWVFSIDADEALSPALREEVRLLKGDEPGGTTGFSMPRCTFYEGQWIRHGDWYPDRLVRLFLRDQARFVGGRVHERLEVDGPVRSLRGDLEHYSFRDLAHHRAKLGKYARQWADDAFDAGRRPGPSAPFLHAGYRWLRALVLRGGFLDGRLGWRIAALTTREVFEKYRLLRYRMAGGEPVFHEDRPIGAQSAD